MNKKNVYLAAVLTLGGLIALNPCSRAADDKAVPPATVTKEAEKSGAKAPTRLEPMSEKLGMTLEQQEKLKPILQDEWKKIRELNARTDLSKEQKFQEKQKLLVATIKKVKESKIMTDEQYAKWKEIRDQQLSPPTTPAQGGKK
jgi:hypothetical protein